MAMISAKCCAYCNELLEGRRDKKFCSDHCRSSYHYDRSREKAPNLFKTIDRQLKDNRRILKEYNKGGKVTVRKEILSAEGFDPRYFTHYWKNGKGQVYLFCYEYGFLSVKEYGKEKYVLVTWQDYMEKGN